MEDLVPLIFFLVIVVVNVLKFLIEKGGKARNAPEKSGEAPPKRASPLESFFTDLAEQMAPKPTEPADWPEGHERPDYAQEMEEFEHARAEEHVEVEEWQAAEVIPPIPMPKPYAVETHHSNKAKIRLQIKGGKTLRQAMLAHIVFSAPRALDPSYSDTLAKYN